MSRKSNTAQRREEIVDAMLAVMATSGYEKATIQAIAQQAGLAPGLIHYHFKRKEDILLASVDSIAALTRARFDTLADAAVTPDARLEAYIEARLAVGAGASPKAVAAWVAIGAEAVRQPDVRNAYQAVIQAELALVQGLVEACLKARKKKVRQGAEFATVLLAFTEGAFQLSSAARDVMPKGYAAASARQLMERLLAGAE